MSRTISYDTAVSRGRRVVATQSKINWSLGDIAATVKPTYGDETIQRLADDIGVEYRTLLDMRRVADAYSVSERSEVSWTVHQVFASEADRAELVQLQWSVSEARAEIARRRSDGDTDGDTDGDDRRRRPTATTTSRQTNWKSPKLKSCACKVS